MSGSRQRERALRCLALSGALLALGACGDDSGAIDGMDAGAGNGRPPSSDSGLLTFDANMLRRDGGFTPTSPEAGSRFDLGPSPADSGPPGPGPGPGCSYAPGPAPGDCVLHIPAGRFGPLIDDCFPRCTPTTAAAYRACSTQVCRDDAVEGDPTPGLDYYIGSVPIHPALNCASCVKYQEFHCFSLVCPVQVENYAEYCIALADDAGCDLALSRLDLCLAILDDTQRSTVRACFASHDGPEACFPCG